MSRRSRFFSFSPLLTLVTLVAVERPAQAQDVSAVAEGATVGYELALQGRVHSELGAELRLHGVAYEVEGLATLRVRQGLVVDAVVTARRGAGPAREEISRATARTEADGRFELDLQIPERPLPAPRVTVTVHRAGQPGRAFTWPLSTAPPHHIDLLTDRNRYEPGETVHAWARVTAARGGAPRRGARLRVTLTDASGRPAGEHTITTSEAGVATADLELPDSATDGAWTVRTEVLDGGLAPPAARTISITRRTVERLQAELHIDQDLVRPGGALTGYVRVRDPSGAAVRGARVELHQGSGDPLLLRSDAEGLARFSTTAPAFLSGDVATQRLEARVVHAAHGTIRAAATYLVSRVTWLVEVTPGTGALVPEVNAELFLHVHDPRGRPVPAGTKVRVRGRGLPRGQAELAVDERGQGADTLALPRGAAARRRAGDCAGDVATSLEVEVLSSPPVVARLCVPVAPEALVSPRAERAVVEPGGDVTVAVQRRPSVRARPVLVEALWSGRAVAWARLAPGSNAVALRVPRDVTGVVELRARPMYPANHDRPLDEPGATLFGRGASTALLARPGDAFALEVRPERELWRIRERAAVELRASRAPERGWATLLVRDQAAHGGEEDFDLDWIREELREAVAASDEPAGDRLLRVALAGLLSPDPAQAEPPPLITPPWSASRYGGAYPAGSASSRGVLRDPIARREELLRRGLAPITRALEQAVSRLGSSAKARRGIVRRTGGRVTFDPEVVANLVAARQLSETQARTLGGEPLTVAMLTAADPSFTFDAVARRVARARLVRLLQALLRFADPDDPNAARASAGEPPTRWLSRLVQLGVVDAEALIDPWGRPFVFRRVTGGRRPVVVVSERALDFELVSPGPDGVVGSADDVRDPFERVVARGTPYAVSSGEDALMEQLSRIAPGARVLQSMVRAYQRVALAAREEQRRGPVEATGSEDMAPMEQTLVETDEEYGGLELRGAGRGGGGVAPAAPSPARRARSAPLAEAEVAADELDRVASPSPEPVPLEPPMDAPPPGGMAAAMGEIVREEFPATLLFVAEIPIDAQGRARVEVPLADALTTYRLEAIAWTASGWTTSAMSRLRVDQEAMIDAPVPPVATVGDHLRLPVRVVNRTGDPLPARIEVEAEGDLALGSIGDLSVEVPPREAVEAILDVSPSAAGDGSLLVRAVRADNGRPLDAVRRPMEVLADLRLARERREELIEAGEVLRVEVPAQASERGPGELRVAVGAALFGDPARWAAGRGQTDRLWAGWTLVATGQQVPEELLEPLLRWVPGDEHEEWYRGPMETALALAILWGDDRMSDSAARAGLRTVSATLPSEEVGGELAPAVSDGDWLLLALAPVIRHRGRADLRDDVDRLAERLRRAVSSAAAQATDAPVIWARAAAALALSEPGAEGEDAENARALEMIRRARRDVIAVGDERWLEPADTDGTFRPRVEPTALLALALLALEEDRGEALALLRSLTRIARNVDQWPGRGRALAAAAAASLTPGGFDPEQMQVRLDGRAVETRGEEGVIVAVLEGLGRPGTHEIDLQLAPGQVALAWVDLRYGLPWSVRPRREATVDLEWTGSPGVRDGRAGLRLEVRNRGARILTRPVVEIELPAGTELDEPTREALAERLVAPATVEGRTLRLQLRPLAPGGYLRLPLPLRWSLSGTLIGLGTTFWNDAGPEPLATRPVRVLPSRGVEIADRGDEPRQREHEASTTPPDPRPLPPRPIEPLAAEVL